MMSDSMWSLLQVAASGGVGGFFGWVFTRKRQQAETKVVETDALSKIQESYSTLTQHMNDKFADMQNEIDSLHKENLQLKKLIKELKTKS